MTPCLALPRELTIYTVGELRPLWLDRLTAGSADPVDPWPVDASAVEEVDAAGLQLVVSLSNWLAREQRRLQLTHPSPVLEKACVALGVSALLTQPPTSASQASPAKARRAPAKAKPASRNAKVVS